VNPKTFKYFAYGSNMCSGRLRERVACEFATIAILPRHQLRFRKLSRDHSSKCDICSTGDEAHAVWGVVYDLSTLEKAKLDAFEGLGKGYDDLEVVLNLPNGEDLRALTYVAHPDSVREGLAPYSWYKAYVLAGATEYELPQEYIAEAIAPIGTTDDPNRERHAKEMAKLEAWEAVRKRAGRPAD